MRHVDHPHHAEGDREADGGEQQHRTEAHALEETAKQPPARDRIVDGVERFGGRRAHGGSALAAPCLGGDAGHQRADLRIDETGEAVQRRDSRPGVLRQRQLPARQRAAQALRGVVVGLGRERRFEQRQRLGCRGPEYRVRRGDAPGRVGVAQRERPQRRPQHLA